MKSEISPDLINSMRSAEKLAVLTGAGISAESGVPTFRDAQTGLWRRYRAEDLATPQAFLREPRLVWEWYAWRRELIRDARPNPGHLALVEMEKHAPAFTLITQNVDGLHQLAGSGGRTKLIELHGNIQRTKCYDENKVVETWQETGAVPPRCPACGGMLRPDVVWFGEALPEDALQSAREASGNCDIFFSIGTSSLVQPAASLPYLALDHGALVVEINPTETPLSSQATYTLHGAAGEVLPGLVQAVWGKEDAADNI